jgi:hypothetical protein
MLELIVFAACGTEVLSMGSRGTITTATLGFISLIWSITNLISTSLRPTRIMRLGFADAGESAASAPISFGLGPVMRIKRTISVASFVEEVNSPSTCWSRPPLYSAVRPKYSSPFSPSLAAYNRPQDLAPFSCSMLALALQPYLLDRLLLFGSFIPYYPLLPPLHPPEIRSPQHRATRNEKQT